MAVGGIDAPGLRRIRMMEEKGFKTRIKLTRKDQLEMVRQAV